MRGVDTCSIIDYRSLWIGYKHTTWIHGRVKKNDEKEKEEEMKNIYRGNAPRKITKQYHSEISAAHACDNYEKHFWNNYVVDGSTDGEPFAIQCYFTSFICASKRLSIELRRDLLIINATDNKHKRRNAHNAKRTHVDLVRSVDHVRMPRSNVWECLLILRKLERRS